MSLLHAAGQAAEIVRQPSFLSETGRTLVDGTLIVAVLKIVEAGINRRKKRASVPLPAPGEAEACKRHLGELHEVKGKVEQLGEKVAKYEEFKERAVAGLERIETKVDDLKDMMIERGGRP